MKIIAILLVVAAQASGGEVWFAPAEDIATVIVAEFDKATKTIDYQLYGATAVPIGNALIRAEHRGVVVRMLLDYRANVNNQYSQAMRCKAAGIEVRLDGTHPIAHSKVRIIDGKLVLAGSYNDSAQAQKNAENLTREDDPKLVAAFADNFAVHWAHGKPFVAQTTKTRRRLR